MITHGQQGIPGTARDRSRKARDRAGIARDRTGIARDRARIAQTWILSQAPHCGATTGMPV